MVPLTVSYWAFFLIPNNHRIQVREAREKGIPVRAVGSGHSFNDVNEPALRSYVINLARNYNKVVRIDKLPSPQVGGVPGSLPVVAHGTVQGGIQLRNLTYQLSKLGYG
jgi:FAD/FMN-containing dehydrogenase